MLKPSGQLLTTSLALCLLLTPLPVQAATVESSSSPVTATVPSTGEGGSVLPPSPPLLLRPADGTITADSTPEFVWRQSVDPDSNTVYYDLYLDDTAIYLGISNSANSSSSLYASELYDTEIRLIPTAELTEGPHTWYVKAYDLGGSWAQSAKWSFTIDTTPPYFVVSSIDNYHNLALDSREPSSVNSETSFEVTGPKEVFFTLLTEPYTTIQLSFFDLDGALIASSNHSAGSSTALYPYQHLELGTYLVQVSATDPAGLTAVLPPFELLVTSPPTLVITLPFTPTFPSTSSPPPSSPPPLTLEFTIPRPLYDLPSQVINLPVTTARLYSRVGIAVIIYLLIAIAIIILLILFKKRRYNLVLLKNPTIPLPYATVYHSRPPHRSTTHHLDPKDRGRLYLPLLAPFSTLTIRTPLATTVLSVSKLREPLVLIIS